MRKSGWPAYLQNNRIKPKIDFIFSGSCRPVVTIVLIFCSFVSVWSQPVNNARVKKLAVDSDTLIVDSLSIIPGTVTITSDGFAVPDSLYHLNYSYSRLFLDTASDRYTDSVLVKYRVFPYDFIQSVYHRDYSKVLQSETYKETHEPVSEGSFDPFGYSGLDHSGSIARGISFGNQQDAIMNSQLNLQLSGKISNEFMIKAAMTDDNIPVQPQGYSQKIEEFDRVFIQVYNDQLGLTAGDYETYNQEGHFLRFAKRLKGAKFTYKGNKEKSPSFDSELSAAISKGKYARQRIDAQEGNQGPYQLTGNDGEMYIIVLAGSEKVYIDGRLLKRGERNDYVMDYNNAEISFTSNCPVNSDKRIIVEFEYSALDYTRFMVFNRERINTQKGDVWVHYYHEQDAKNQNLRQDLSEEDKNMLAGIGDELDEAVKLTGDRVGFVSDEVRYRKTDTLLSGDSVYVYSTDPQKALYRVHFSFVGDHNGNYVLVKSAANGRVYKWVAPQDGVPQGNYAPVTRISTPKRHQVLSIGGETQITGTTSSMFELSLSERDLNAFSGLDSKDNKDIAFWGRVDQLIFENRDKTGRLNARIDYEYAGSHFEPVQRYRSVEFDRDWNIRDLSLDKDENLLQYTMNYSNDSLGNGRYQFQYLNNGSQYRGLRNYLSANMDWKKTRFDFAGSILNTEYLQNHSVFLRHRGELSQGIGQFRAGIAEEAENNQWNHDDSTGLLPNSYAYQEYEAFVSHGDTNENQVRTNYVYRTNQLPQKGGLKESSYSRDVGLSYYLRSHSRHQLNLTLTYRRLNLTDTAIAEKDENKSLLGRFDHQYRSSKGLFSSGSFYELGSGMEMVKEYLYIDVGPGQGIYQWIDYNENQVQELNEFEQARYEDKARFIKVSRPSDEMERVLYNRFNQRFSLQPARIWQNAKGWKKFLSYFSEQVTYKIFQKRRDASWVSMLMPVEKRGADNKLSHLNYSLRNNLSFRHTKTGVNIDYILQQQKQVNRLVNGTETSKADFNKVKLRWRLHPDVYLINIVSKGNKRNESEYYPGKNYLLTYLSENVGFDYQPGISLRLNMNYHYQFTTNRKGKEKAVEHRVETDISTPAGKQGNLTGQVAFVYFDFTGNVNSPVGFEVLKGLRPGKNLTMGLSLQRNIIAGLELDLSYEGRLSEKQKMIHWGSVQLRALF